MAHTDHFLCLCSVREINWDYIGDAVPAFLTLIIIPLSYKCVPFFHLLFWQVTHAWLFSIAYGVIAGVMSYIILNGFPVILKKVSGGRIIPPNYDAAEEWVVPPGGLVPYWMYALLFRCVSFRVNANQYPYSLKVLGRAPPLDDVPLDGQFQDPSVDTNSHDHQAGSKNASELEKPPVEAAA
jgi:AGZA family xanthine/uracil permease-like MFS transporter